MFYIHVRMNFVGIAFRTGPITPCLSYKVIKLGRPSNKTVITDVTCHNRCGTIKITPCSKAKSTEECLNFTSYYY